MSARDWDFTVQVPTEEVRDDLIAVVAEAWSATEVTVGIRFWDIEALPDPRTLGVTVRTAWEPGTSEAVMTEQVAELIRHHAPDMDFGRGMTVVCRH